MPGGEKDNGACREAGTLVAEFTNVSPSANAGKVGCQRLFGGLESVRVYRGSPIQLKLVNFELVLPYTPA